MVLTAVGLMAVLPRSADAQGRRGGRRGPAVRSVVVIGGYRYEPYWFYDFYDPWYQWGPYPYPYPPYGYGYGVRDQLTSSIRLQVTPRDAQVFVDGYVAGTVDDFDGVFQRLRLRPGNHQIALYLEGYRTIVQNLYVNPGADQKIAFTMERLQAGDVSEPPPQPAPVARAEPGGEDQQPPPPDQLPPAPRRSAPRPPAPPREAPARFGTLSIRVQPADAEILVDGERWSAPADSDRIGIQLAEGRHHVEVRKEGYSPYAEDVLIRRDGTLTLNVSLLHGDEAGR